MSPAMSCCNNLTVGFCILVYCEAVQSAILAKVWLLVLLWQTNFCLLHVGLILMKRNWHVERIQRSVSRSLVKFPTEGQNVGSGVVQGPGVVLEQKTACHRVTEPSGK